MKTKRKSNIVADSEDRAEAIGLLLKVTAVLIILAGIVCIIK